MAPKTHNIIHTLLAIATIGLSIVLFVASLFFSAFNLFDNGSVDGFTALLMGWTGLFMLDNNKGYEIGFLGWYANLFFLPIWLGLALSVKFRVMAFIGFALTLVGMGVAVCSVQVKNVLINEGGGTAEVMSMGLGFYIWLISFAVCLLGYFAVTVWSFLKPKMILMNQ